MGTPFGTTSTSAKISFWRSVRESLRFMRRSNFRQALRKIYRLRVQDRRGLARSLSRKCQYEHIQIAGCSQAQRVSKARLDLRSDSALSRFPSDAIHRLFRWNESAGRVG